MHVRAYTHTTNTHARTTRLFIHSRLFHFCFTDTCNTRPLLNAKFPRLETLNVKWENIEKQASSDTRRSPRSFLSTERRLRELRAGICNNCDSRFVERKKARKKSIISVGQRIVLFLKIQFLLLFLLRMQAQVRQYKLQNVACKNDNLYMSSW